MFMLILGQEPIEIEVDDWLYALTFSPNGEYLLSGGRGGVQVWRVEDGQRTATMNTKNIVFCLAVSMDGGYIAAGTDTGELFVWDGETHEPVLEHKKDGFEVTTVDFSPASSRQFVSASRNSIGTSDSSSAAVWDLGTRKQVQILRHDDSNHSIMIQGAKYSPRGDRIATATDDSVRVWDCHDGRLLMDIKVTVDQWSNRGLLWFSSLQLLVLSNRKIIQIDASTGTPISEWPILDTSGSSCIAQPMHKEFIAYSTRRTVSFLDAVTRTELGLVEHTENIYSIAFSADDRFIAIGGEYGTINVENISHITVSNTPTRII